MIDLLVTMLFRPAFVASVLVLRIIGAGISLVTWGEVNTPIVAGFEPKGSEPFFESRAKWKENMT